MTHQGAPSTSILNNDLTTSPTADHKNFPSLTHSEPSQKQQSPPSLSQGATTAHSYIPPAPDFPICDDRSEFEPDDNGISSNDDFSSSSGTRCTPITPLCVPNRKRNQKTRRKAEASKRAGSSFPPSPPPHAQQHPHVKPSQEQRQRRKRAPSGLEGTLPMSSNEDLSLSGTVRHLKSSSGPLFTLLAPSLASSASTFSSSPATSRGYSSSSIIATTTSTRPR